MKRLLLIICLITFSLSFAQKEKSTFYVVFKHNVSISDATSILDEIPEIQVIVEKHNIKFKPGILLSKDKKKHLENCSKKVALRKKQKNYTKLSNIFIAYKKDKKTLDAEALKSELESLDQVKYCYVSSGKMVAPPTINNGDIPPTTDDFSTNQTYIQSNPGVNMQYAWDKGYNGAGISIADLEYGANLDHEDIASTNASIASGMTINAATDPNWIHHGTAVAGIVYAGNNGFGITGLAHGADKYTFYSEYTEEKGWDRIYTITRAIEEAKEGDVIIFELQMAGLTEQEFVPAEYDKIVWELTKSASDAGITIVAAAGNGNANLDADGYNTYRDYGDSGAIIVGGGTPDTAHNKVSYSTYGSRVNLQGWAENVWSISKHGHDYPAGTCTVTLFGDDENQAYTSCFRGTSSATPIVASCAAVLQGYYYSQSQQYLTSLQLREILVSTGIAQGSGGHIGPLPNMQAAMEKIDSEYLLSTPKESFNANFIVSPNPTNGDVTVVMPEYFSGNISIEIYNALGQLIKGIEGTIGTNAIDLSNLNTGIYIIEVADNTYRATKKVVKR